MKPLSTRQIEVVRELADTCEQFPSLSLETHLADFDGCDGTLQEFPVEQVRKYLVRYARVFFYEGEWLNFTDFDTESRQKLTKYSTDEYYHLTEDDLSLV